VLGPLLTDLEDTVVKFRRARAVFAAAAVAACTLSVAGTADVAAGTASPADATACGGELVNKADGTPWQCTFDDEFDGTALDTSKWVPQLTATSTYTTGSTAGKACYVDTPDNIAVANGVLSLTARKEVAPFTCQFGANNTFDTQYTSGMVSTNGKFSQQYGRFEVRAKLPKQTSKGLQETLWLYPNDVHLHGNTWPMSGEIDFAEFYTVKHAKVIPVIHYPVDTTASDQDTNTNTYTAVCSIKFPKFNTYVVEWEPGTVTIWVNGKTCLIDHYVPAGMTSPAPFDQPFFLALTQALGTGLNGNAFDAKKTKLPATMQIDYVRAWS
jgi:beta-glucanase (GH16 family)